jgi:hypothetical protein
MCYSFNAKALKDDCLYKVQFLNPVDPYGLPQNFLLHTSQVMVFLPEEPNAPYYITRHAREFLKNFSEDLKKYMLEFA